MLLKHKQTLFAIRDISTSSGQKGTLYTFGVVRIEDDRPTQLTVFIQTPPTDITEIGSKGESIRHNYVALTLNNMLMAQAKYFDLMKKEGYFDPLFIQKEDMPVFNLTNFNVFANSLATTNGLSRNVVNVEGVEI